MAIHQGVKAEQQNRERRRARTGEQLRQLPGADQAEQEEQGPP